MQINSDECSFMNYYDSEDEALFIVSSLKTEGFHDVQLSHVSEFPRQYVYTGNHNLSSRILGRGYYDEQYGPLLAADPSVSGMASHPGQDFVSAYLVTVVANRVETDKVQHLLNRDNTRY